MHLVGCHEFELELEDGEFFNSRLIYLISPIVPSIIP